MVESANDIVTSLDPRGMILTWNSTAERVSGYIERELLSKPLTTICADTQKATLASIIEEPFERENGKAHRIRPQNKDGQDNPHFMEFRPDAG